MRAHCSGGSGPQRRLPERRGEFGFPPFTEDHLLKRPESPPGPGALGRSQRTPVLLWLFLLMVSNSALPSCCQPTLRRAKFIFGTTLFSPLFLPHSGAPRNSSLFSSGFTSPRNVPGLFHNLCLPNEMINSSRQLRHHVDKARSAREIVAFN